MYFQRLPVLMTLCEKGLLCPLPAANPNINTLHPTACTGPHPVGRAVYFVLYYYIRYRHIGRLKSGGNILRRGVHTDRLLGTCWVATS